MRQKAHTTSPAANYSIKLINLYEEEEEEEGFVRQTSKNEMKKLFIFKEPIPQIKRA